MPGGPTVALERLGIEARSISEIVLTHLPDDDHVGNLGDFPEAELIVHEEELAFWSGPCASQPEFAPHVETEEIAGLLRARDAGRVRTPRRDRVGDRPGNRQHLRRRGTRPGSSSSS